MNENAKIYVAGHRGLVGSAVVRVLQNRGYTNILSRTSAELDLRKQDDVESFFQAEKPEYVVLAAAKVGGIMANATYPAEFIYDNIMISSNIIHAAYRSGVKKLINLGSSCIYPKLAPQPLKEEYLLTGPLEPTNEAYAVAKIAAIKMCSSYNRQYGTNFLSIMPTNLFGPNDNFDTQTSHVLPALITKFHRGKEIQEGRGVQPDSDGTAEVVLWGDGSPKREFLYADDLAEAILFLLENCNADDLGEFVNIGTGEDITIKELASKVADIVGYTGEITWDTSKPTGTPRKLLDVSRINTLGWKAFTPLTKGIEKTYEWFKEKADRI